MGKGGCCSHGKSLVILVSTEIPMVRRIIWSYPSFMGKI